MNQQKRGSDDSVPSVSPMIKSKKDGEDEEESLCS